MLAVIGVLLIAEAVVTVVWQEPFSALSANRAQHKLSRELERMESVALPVGSAGAHARGSQGALALRARALEKRTDIGKALGRIRVPKLGIDFVFVKGTGIDPLKKGPGHYIRTALPGQRGTVGIAGHRTTYLAPFRHIDALRRGDTISVRMPYGRFRYKVEGSRVVVPSNDRVLRAVGHDRLVLTTCTPPFSDAKRLVVLARLAAARPR